MPDKINIQGLEIRIKQVNEKDFLSLTDLSRKNTEREPNEVIRDWIRNSSTINFLEVWEMAYNPNFKPEDLHGFRKDASNNRILLTPQKYIEATGAIGIISKSGRYGGTYAHLDIALEFASWLDPVFRFYIWKDYQRLKEAEQKRLNSDWTFSRFLSKVNYQIHTEAIKENLVPRSDQPEPYTFASEADMLNMVIFGMTAKQWREAYPEEAKAGNIRDYASTEQLVVLANMEAINAMLIDAGASQSARYDRLFQAASKEMQILQNRGLLPGKE